MKLGYARGAAEGGDLPFFVDPNAALKRRSSTTISTIALSFQEVPGFLKFGMLCVVAMGAEEDFGLVGDFLDGDDVPGVGGDYVGGDEVDLVGAVGDSVGGDAAAVGVPAFLLGAFDPFGRFALSGQALDAAEAGAVFGGEVVGRRVSPGLGDAEAEFGGAGHETELRPLAAGFGVADVHSFIWH